MVCCSQGIYSQISLGLINGNYSGSNSIIINPSLMANSKLKADINLVSLNAFAENNYLYFPARDASLIKLFNGSYDYHFFPKPYGDGERRVYTYYQDKSLKNIFTNVRIIGPSAMISIHDHVFAVSTSFRMMSSTRRLPYDMANFSYYGMDFKPQQNILYTDDNYDVASLAWGELKFSYATVINRSGNNLWSAGISAGPAFGYAGAYLTGGETRYIAYNDSTLNVEELNAEIGMSLPLNYEQDKADFVNPVIRGYGWGMDLGISWQYRERHYQKRTPRNCYKRSFEDYKFKVGVSLLDIGWVKFTKNAEKHIYDHVQNNLIKVNEMRYDNIGGQLNSISSLFYENEDESLEAKSIKIYMPATFSVQFDYHMTDWWYVNTTLILPAKYTSPMVERPMVLAVTPRFESRFLEVNVPFVLYDFKYPRVGLSIRVEGLTVGTDNLGGFLSAGDFTGADVYISYKVNLANDRKNPYASRGACYNNWRYDLKKTHKTNF
jgi:hypothetical protein